MNSGYVDKGNSGEVCARIGLCFAMYSLNPEAHVTHAKVGDFLRKLYGNSVIDSMKISQNIADGLVNFVQFIPLHNSNIYGYSESPKIDEALLKSGLLRACAFIAKNNCFGVDLIIPMFLADGRVSAITVQVKNLADTGFKSNLNEVMQKAVPSFKSDFSRDLIERPFLALVFQFRDSVPAANENQVINESENVLQRSARIAGFSNLKRAVKAKLDLSSEHSESEPSDSNSSESSIEEKDIYGAENFSVSYFEKEIIQFSMCNVLNQPEIQGFRYTKEGSQQSSHGIASLGINVFSRFMSQYELTHLGNILKTSSDFTDSNSLFTPTDRLLKKAKLRTAIPLSYSDSLSQALRTKSTAILERLKGAGVRFRAPNGNGAV